MALNLRNVDGVYHLVIKGAAGRDHLISTGATDKKAARILIKSADLEPVVAAHVQAAKDLAGEVEAVLKATQHGNCEQVIAEWEAYMKLKGSRRTAEKYAEIMRHFCKEHSLTRAPIQVVTLERLMAWVNEPTKKYVTRNLRQWAVRSLFEYANARGYLKNNHSELLFINFRAMTVGQLEKKPRKPITPEDYTQIMAKAEGFWRWATALAYWTGLRIGDVCCLERESLTREPGSIIVWTKKRNKRVALPLDDPLIGSGELRSVIAEILAQCDGERCFPAKYGLYLLPWTGELSNDYKDVLRKAGVDEPGKSFHSLRHACITRWKNAGKTLESIGALVGHSSTETTQLYVHA